MRVSKLLTELNITFKELKRYQPFLNIVIESINQSLPDEVMQNMISLRNDPNVQDQLRDEIEKEKNEWLVEKDKMNDAVNAFYHDGVYKFIAKLKWYFDESKNGKYGFVTLDNGLDFYFKGAVVKGVAPTLLKNDELLVVTVEEKNFNSKGSAALVYRLEDETDVGFMIYHTLNKKVNYFIDKIKSQWVQIKQNEQEVFKIKINDFIDLFIATNKSNKNELNIVFHLAKIGNIDDVGKLEAFINDKLEENELFIFWEKNDIVCPFIKIKNLIIEKVASNSSAKIELLKRLSITQIDEVINSIFLNLISDESSNTNHKLKELVELANNFKVNIDLTTLNDEQLFYAWFNEILEEMPIDAVYNTLLHWYQATTEEKIVRSKIQKIDFHNDEFEKINFSEITAKISIDDYKNIFAKSHLDIDKINSDIDFNMILFFLTYAPEALKEEFSNVVYSKATSYYRLQLFVQDFIDEIEFGEVVIYTGLLSSDAQIIFFKKVIKGIAEETLELSLEDLNEISTIDYQTNEYAKEIDGIGLDFTLYVVLQVLNDLKKKEFTTRKSIFDLIAQQIKTPSDLLVIKGFFQICDGRSIIKDTVVKDESGVDKKIFYEVKTDYLPRFSIYCDGRKSLHKNTGLPNLCDKSKFEFWWCENNQCYQVCRTSHTIKDWKKYSLEDVLRVLKIDYDERQYEILLNVINRVNRFLTHLSCKSCGKILKPKGKSKYAFYGVTRFYCDDPICDKHQEEIYLSHCLNGQCEDIIDSRETAKCKSVGHSDESGWYICKNCYACCSTEKLVNRKNNLEMNGHTYHGHLIGHRDKGVVCCTSCGNEMLVKSGSLFKYNELLSWFIEHKSKHPNIKNSGQNKYDKWWFIWARGHFSYEVYRKQLQSMYVNGFNIPDFNDKLKDSQLIAEPKFTVNFDTDPNFICSHCDHQINLNDKINFDFYRKKAFKSFHEQIFPRVTKDI